MLEAVWAATVGAKGDGLSLGLTSRGTNYGMAYDGNSGSGPNGMTMSTAAYGAAVGTSAASSSQPQKHSVGVTTDATKSGVVVDLSQAVIPTISACIKYT